MAEQLPLDFSDSAAVRHRKAVKAATQPTDDDQPRLFMAAPNLDVHLHSTEEAVAQITGPDPERSGFWLQQLVGTVRWLKPRRVAFPTSTLDRLLSIRPPAQVTLDASALAVARAIWAAKLGLKPLRVHRDRQRLLASSQRWPSGFAVKDAPWPAIATVEALGLPLEIDARAQALMTEKLVKSGSHIASAGLAGSAVILETTRPDLLDRLKLPALSYAGSKESGRYRMPLLSAECLLAEPSIRVSPDLASAIKRATAKVKPLVPPDGFPWTLYGFQARDAARGKRILETTGGVLLAGTMGSGKSLSAKEPVLTPSGWRPIGGLKPGDEVYGSDGRPHRILGVYPQGELDLFTMRFSDGAEVVCSGDHLWAVRTADDKHWGRDYKVLNTDEIVASGLTYPNGNARWYIPMTEPVQFPDTGNRPLDPYVLGALIGDGRIADGLELWTYDAEIAHEVGRLLPPGARIEQCPYDRLKWAIRKTGGYRNPAISALRELGLHGHGFATKFIPDAYKYGPLAVRWALLQGLMDTGGGLAGSSKSAASLEFTTSSSQLAEDFGFLVESFGGTARMTVRHPVYTYKGQKKRSTNPSYRFCVALPAHLGAPFRLPRKRDAFVPRVKYQPTRAIVAVEPAGRADAVCIQVDTPDRLFLTRRLVASHNTTVSLALAADMDIWPLLVVAPLAAFSTWARQLGEMGKSYYLAKETPAKSWAAIDEGDWDAVVISYDRLHAFVELIEHQGYAGIIADELQRIRTPGSRRSRAIRALASAVPLRIGLSGTPLTNKLDDLLPLGAFLVPGEWKPRANAKDLEDLYPGDPVEAVADHLGSMMVRRTMEQTGVKLPDRNLHRIMVALTPEQRRALEDLEAEAEAAKESGELENEGKLHAFVRLQRMRQIVADPTGAGIGGRNPKVDAAVDLVEEFLEQGRKGVVFCADRRVWREVGAELDRAGIGWTGIWGSTPIQDRIDNEKRFHTDPDCKIVLCTVQAASESVTFSPTATFLICLSYVYAPSTMDQMEARIYRMNTVEPVEICYLHAKAPGGTLDDRIVEILTVKRELFAKVVDRTTHTDSTKVHYSMGDLVYLLTGKRDESLDRREADAKAVVESEQAKKRHARVTAHAHKGKNKTSDDFYDDGSGTKTLEEWMDDEDADLVALTGDDGEPEDDDEFDAA